MSVKFVMNIVYGSVQMGSPTGRYVRDPDGWYREEYTPTRWLDEQGRVTREETFIAPCRISAPPPGSSCLCG